MEKYDELIEPMLNLFLTASTYFCKYEKLKASSPKKVVCGDYHIIVFSLLAHTKSTTRNYSSLKNLSINIFGFKI